MRKKILIAVALLVVCWLLIEGMSGPPTSQNGVAPSMLSDRIMKKYDSNQNGTLEVSEESFLRNESDGVTKVESHGLLFTDADAFGNSDGVVSEEELLRFLEKFDTDGNGEITSYISIFHSLVGKGNEWKKFDESYAEKFKYHETSESSN